MPTNIYESVKKALQDIVAPQLGVIEGKISGLQTEIKRLDEKIDSVKEEVRNLRREVITRIDGLGKQLDTAIDLHERIAALEAKIGH